MRNNNPRDFDARDEWIECPKCRNVMVSLRDFAITDAGEGPSAHADLPEFLLFGWWAYLINYLAEAFSFGGRKSKLATIKAQVLPRAPNSLVCPHCLHVIERN